MLLAGKVQWAAAVMKITVVSRRIQLVCPEVLPSPVTLFVTKHLVAVKVQYGLDFINIGNLWHNR